MKRAIPIFVLCASAVLLASGCSRTEDPPGPKEAKKETNRVSSGQGTVSAPVSPAPPLPDPVVPKGAESPSPMPGQANDHSSPAFKGGGKEDPHK
jgi:hypothetical protein